MRDHIQDAALSCQKPALSRAMSRSACGLPGAPGYLRACGIILLAFLCNHPARWDRRQSCCHCRHCRRRPAEQQPVCPRHPVLHSAVCARCDEDWQTRVHEPGRCATYGICGHRRDGDPLSCPDNGEARPLNATSAQKLQTVCPQLAADIGPGAGVCCTEEQVDQLQKQVGGVPCSGAGCAQKLPAAPAPAVLPLQCARLL